MRVQHYIRDYVDNPSVPYTGTATAQVRPLGQRINLCVRAEQMGTKVRVDQVSIDEIDDWSEQFSEDDDIGRSRLKYNGKRRRQIEDLMEERRLMKQISDVFDEHV